jgi:hypothetical protein
VTDYDPYDDDAHRQEARLLAAQDAIHHRLQLLATAGRPSSTPGALDPAVADWITRYQAGAPRLPRPRRRGRHRQDLDPVEDRRHPGAGGWAGRFEIAAAYEVKAATDRPGNPAAVDLWKRADLFAIDDLGAQRVNDWDAERLHALIDTRWQHKRPTLLASNVADLKVSSAPAPPPASPTARPSSGSPATTAGGTPRDRRPAGRRRLRAAAPHDDSAEQAVLGAMMISRTEIANVIETPRQRRLLPRIPPGPSTRPIVDMYGRGRPVDPVTLADELRDRGELVRVGGAPYLHTASTRSRRGQRRPTTPRSSATCGPAARPRSQRPHPPGRVRGQGRPRRHRRRSPTRPRRGPGRR